MAVTGEAMALTKATTREAMAASKAMNSEALAAIRAVTKLLSRDEELTPYMNSASLIATIIMEWIRLV